MTQAETLYYLQEVELEILRIRKRLAEIATALEDNTAIQAAQHRVETAEKALRPLRAKMNDMELESQANIQKTKANEQRLYSGNVKNPKELQDMQQEIESLKKWQIELENRLLDAMVDVEGADEELAEAQANLQSVTANWESEHQDLLAEKAGLESQLAEQNTQRQTILKQVNADTLQYYNGLKPRKSNQPVAIMQGKTCNVCGIEQTSAIEQAVYRSADLVHCEGCGRILVHLGNRV